MIFFTRARELRKWHYGIGGVVLIFESDGGSLVCEYLLAK